MQARLTSKKPTARSMYQLPFKSHPGQTLYHRALRLHPDKGGDPELFKEVTHA